MKPKFLTLHTILLATLPLVSVAAHAGSTVTIKNHSQNVMEKTSGPWGLPNTIQPGDTITYEITHGVVIVDDEFKATYEREDGQGGCEFTSRVYTVESGSYYVPAYESSANDSGSGVYCRDYLSNERWSEPYGYEVEFSIY